MTIPESDTTSAAVADPWSLVSPAFLTEHDLVAKLRLVQSLVNREPYRNIQGSYFQRIRDALSAVPHPYWPAALAIYANVIYLGDTFSNDAWRYLWQEIVQQYHPTADSNDFAKNMHIFSLDGDEHISDFYRINDIPGRLDPSQQESAPDYGLLATYLVDMTSPHEGITALGRRVIERLATKSFWLILSDNVLSGQSLKSELKRYAQVLELLGEVGPYPRVLVLAQILTSDAMTAVQQELGSDRMSLFNIHCATYFDQRFKINSPQSRLITDADTRRNALQLCDWLATNVLVKDAAVERHREDSGDDLAFGFRAGGWTIIRQGNAPSNSLPLLWYPRTNPEITKYRGPFPRDISRSGPKEKSAIASKSEELQNPEVLSAVREQLRQLFGGDNAG